MMFQTAFTKGVFTVHLKVKETCKTLPAVAWTTFSLPTMPPLPLFRETFGK